jgi:RimJ/RimL family protein N-acetyltransferase
MKYSFQKVTADEWAVLADSAHLVVFETKERSKLDRIDFALLILADDELGGYFTCKEMDSETLYIQYGGVFPQFQKTIHAMHGYKLFIKWAKEHYKRLSTKIENKNLAMIKMALQVGFLITGVNVFKEKILLELSMEV